MSYMTWTHDLCLYELEQLVCSDDTKSDSYIYWVPLQRTVMFASNKKIKKIASARAIVLYRLSADM